MTRRTDLIERLAGARPANLDPVPDDARRSRDLEAALGFAGEQAPARRRRIGRRATFGLGLLAAGTAAAVAITLVESGDSSGPAQKAQPGTQWMSARQVLLAAASTAEKQPATDGAYWRVRLVSDFWLRRTGLMRRIEETWQGKDGSYWRGFRAIRGEPGNPAPTIRKTGTYEGLRFDLNNMFVWWGGGPQHGVYHPLTLDQIRGLPTDPGSLTKWLDTTIRRDFRKFEARGEVKPVSPGNRQYVIDLMLTTSLIGLLWHTPTPPKARAAAFRALADRPGVKGGGTATDPRGRKGRLISYDDERYIIDPRTTRLLSVSIDSGSGKTRLRRSNTYLEIGWTNEKPHVPDPL